MAANNNSLRSIKLPSVNKFAILGLVLLILATIVALYYMSKSTESFTNNMPNLTTTSGEYIIVLFYTDWCPHCQHFKPEYKKAINNLNGKTGIDDKILRLEMVDCEAHKDLAKKYNVNGYPTVKIIKDNGDVDEYDGERNYDALYAYLVKN